MRGKRILIGRKQIYSYTDNYGKNHRIGISEADIKCIPYNIIDTGIKALYTQNIYKIMFLEKYNDITLCSKSIIGKCDDSLLNKILSKDEINKIAISEKTLKEIIDNFEKQENNDEPDFNK